MADQLLIAFMVNQAERLRCLLHRYRQVPWLEPSDDVTKWGVGQFTSGRVLLRNQPGRLDRDLCCDELLHADSESPLLIAHASMSETTPPNLEYNQPFRLRRWLFATEGAIDLEGRRRDLLDELPQFLRDARKGRLDQELLFLHFLAALYNHHLLDQQADPKALVPLLGELAQTVQTPLNILTTNGQVLLAYRSGRPLFYCLFEGMRHCERCGISDTVRRLAPLVTSHRRLKGICVTSRPFATPETWQEIPERGALVVGPAMSIRFITTAGNGEADSTSPIRMHVE
jgi:glutamine amidotransferase